MVATEATPCYELSLQTFCHGNACGEDISDTAAWQRAWLKRRTRAVAASGVGVSWGDASATSSSDLISSMATAMEVDGGLLPAHQTKAGSGVKHTQERKVGSEEEHTTGRKAGSAKKHLKEL